MRAAALAAVLITVAAPAAWTQTVRGQVKDRVSGRPAQGVVTLVDTGGVLIGRTPTGLQGQYALTAPGPGAYLLQFIGPGYGPYVTSEFSLAAGETRIMGLEAVALPLVTLDTVVVEGRAVPRRLAGFYERKSSGLGEFVTRDDFERLNPSQPTDVLRRMMGLSIVPVENQGYRVLSRRDPRCAPAVFMDDVFMGSGAEFDFDAVLTVEQIEGVEVYGPSQTPPQYNRSDCGAVVIWTRVAGPGVVTVTTTFDLGGEVGGWLSSDGVQNGRVGVRGVLGVGAFEVSPAVNVLVPSFRSAAAVERSGVEILLSVRARPLGRRTPWYAGLGVTFLELDEPGFVTIEEQHFLLLAGFLSPRGFLRPFVELQAQNPFAPSDVRFQLFAGAVVKLY